MRLALLLLTPVACTEGSAPRENAREQTAPQVTHSTLSRAPLTHDREGEKHEHSALDASNGPSPCELIAFPHVGIEDSPHPIVTVYAESCLRWARYEVDQVSAGSNGIPVFVAVSSEALTQLHDTLGDHVVFYPQDYVEEVYGLALGTFVIAHSWPGGLAVGGLGPEHACDLFEEIETQFIDEKLKNAMRQLRVAVTCVAAQRSPGAYENRSSSADVNPAKTRPQTNAKRCAECSRARPRE